MEIKNRLSQRMWNIIDAVVIAATVMILFALTYSLSSCTTAKKGESATPALAESGIAIKHQVKQPDPLP